jgi:hypothetical protein
MMEDLKILAFSLGTEIQRWDQLFRRIMARYLNSRLKGNGQSFVKIK